MKNLNERKNIVLEFETQKYDINQKNSTPKLSHQFESKSLDSMLEIGKQRRSPQMLKDRRLTIEEFYMQTPEHANPGRSSRLSRNFNKNFTSAQFFILFFFKLIKTHLMRHFRLII